MKIKQIGVDLAKNAFQLHGVDYHEQVIVVLQRWLKRANWLKVLLDKIEPSSEIGIGACTGAHHWRHLCCSSHTASQAVGAISFTLYP